MTTQPRTAAGRALSRAWRVRRTASPGLEEAWPEQFDRYILAIEAEAAAPALDVEVVKRVIEGEWGSRAYFWGAAYGTQETAQTLAEAFAAEYARLSADELDVVLRDGNPALRGKWSR